MRRISRTCLAVACIGLLGAGLIGSGIAQEVKETERATAGPEKASEERFSVSVDPRIELLAVVQHFTFWARGGHIKSKTLYKDDIDGYFGEFTGDPAMACVEELVNLGFTHDAPVAFMLHHGDPPEFVKETPYSDYLIERAKGEESLMELADALRDFARKTDFMRFYRTHEALYDTLVAEVNSLLEGKDYVRAIQNLYGESRNSYGLVLSPLFAGGYGPTIETEEGYDIYGVIGPCALRGMRTTFACLGYLESMMLHEWSHSFVNPLVDKNFDVFEKSLGLFQPIEGMMRRQAYPSWRIALYEHIVRACEIHLRANLYEDFRKEESLAYQEGKGFWYISRVDSLLDVYETARKEYPTFAQFVPVIAANLSQISIADLPERITTFVGPLDAIFPRADTIYFVYPTRTDEESVEKVKRDLEHFGAFLSAAQIEPILVSDREALEIDWEEKVGFIYGTPRENLFLEQLEVAIPLAFRDDAIEFGGKRYEGEGILLISCMPNPFNKMLPFAVAIANRAEDLIGAGLRMSGQSEWNVDYVIFRGDEKSEVGCYHKEKGKWSLVPEGN
ncbi:MAG: hypothetical protein AMJ46_04050 [Latescibacteria bacterium DG_63]|nr:MAG: hypothetical protein AMJ46_04050 [Latescibacteria bacterium DG_63]